eukprot:m.19578 g.19578  ORF g.19578 m.19578 type:complete len:367 (+) comp8484_c0_seq1:48-1148(+)
MPIKNPHHDEDLTLGLLNIALADEEQHELHAHFEEVQRERRERHHGVDGRDENAEGHNSRNNVINEERESVVEQNEGEVEASQLSQRTHIASQTPVAGSMMYHQLRLKELLQRRKAEQRTAIRQIVESKHRKTQKEKKKHNSEMRLLRFTNHLVMTSDVEDDQDEDLYFLPFRPEHKPSAFANLFSDDKNMETWMTFNRLSQKDQQTVLKPKAKKYRKKKKSSRSAESRFKLIEKDIRHEIKKNAEPWSAVAGLEWLVRHHLFEHSCEEKKRFLNDEGKDVEALLKHSCVASQDSTGQTILSFGNMDYYGCQMLHAVCKYYKLRTGSGSWDEKTVMLPSSDSLSLPSESLTSHLKKKYGHRGGLTS